MGQCCVSDEKKIHILSIDGIKEEEHASERDAVATEKIEDDIANVEIDRIGKAWNSLMASTAAGIVVIMNWKGASVYNVD